RGDAGPRLRRAGRPMIRYAVYLLLATVSLALQTTWLAGAGVGGAAPDPLIILIMIVGLFHGPEEGAAFGAGVGLLEDVVTGAPLGLGMLADLCVGFAAGLGVRIIYMENVWLPALGAAALSGLRVIVWVGAAHLAVLAIRLWQIQIVQGEYYLRLAEENRIRVTSITAPRGQIRDRQGRPLTLNRPAFTVSLVPTELQHPELVIPEVARRLGMTPQEVAAKLAEIPDRPYE